MANEIGTMAAEYIAKFEGDRVSASDVAKAIGLDSPTRSELIQISKAVIGAGKWQRPLYSTDGKVVPAWSRTQFRVAGKVVSGFRRCSQ